MRTGSAHGMAVSAGKEGRAITVRTATVSTALQPVKQASATSVKAFGIVFRECCIVRLNLPLQGFNLLSRGPRLIAGLIGGCLQRVQCDARFGFLFGERGPPTGIRTRDSRVNRRLPHGGFMRPVPCDQAGKRRSHDDVEDRPAGDEGKEKVAHSRFPIGVVVMRRMYSISTPARMGSAQRGRLGKLS